jgi:hypothetical protein
VPLVHLVDARELGRCPASACSTAVPTVVERPMDFRYRGLGGSSIDGGHNVMSVTDLIAPGSSVVMAEGYTGSGFEQYLTLQNPDPAPVAVTIAYLKADGSAPVTKSLALRANQ